MKVVDEATAWGRDRRAAPNRGVSSFGFSGTNAHVILEEAPEVLAAGPVKPADDRRFMVLPLWKKPAPAALVSTAENYRSWLDVAHPDATLADVCLTAGAARTLLRVPGRLRGEFR